jgi:hypothetical protein
MIDDNPAAALTACSTSRATASQGTPSADLMRQSPFLGAGFVTVTGQILIAIHGQPDKPPRWSSGPRPGTSDRRTWRLSSNPAAE